MEGIERIKTLASKIKDSDLLKIINYYGIMPQLKYFQSEVFELNEAIIDYENEQSFKELLDLKILDSDVEKKKHIAEEIADVLLMINQFVEYYKIQESDINKIIKQKINRQLERIKNEYNKLFPIGTVITPRVFCDNSFTMHLLEKQKKIAIENELNTLNKNKFNAVWGYKEGIGIVRIK